MATCGRSTPESLPLARQVCRASTFCPRGFHGVHSCETNPISLRAKWRASIWQEKSYDELDPPKTPGKQSQFPDEQKGTRGG